jgi:hypothetical protein
MALHPFQCEEALDWIMAVGDDPDLVAIEKAIDRVIGTPLGERLNSEDGHIGWGAAEVVAAYHGRHASKVSAIRHTILTLFTKRPSPRPELVAKAVTVLDRITGAKSEFADVWQRSDRHQDWQFALTDLKRRLQLIRSDHADPPSI